MGLRLLRAAYGIEFLIALVATFEFWSQVGGQTHLDLMAWWWKFGISLGLAGAVVRLTAVSARPAGFRSKAAVAWILVIALVLFVGGVVTYYYHLHEPKDEEDQGTGNEIAGGTTRSGGPVEGSGTGERAGDAHLAGAAG